MYSNCTTERAAMDIFVGEYLPIANALFSTFEANIKLQCSQVPACKTDHKKIDLCGAYMCCKTMIKLNVNVWEISCFTEQHGIMVYIDKLDG